jgi:AcrR family transcriptional regulator
MLNDTKTRIKILSAALNLLLQQGIKKTTLGEVAYQAGVTRVTVYRYFADKRTLVHDSLMTIPAALTKLDSVMTGEGHHDVDSDLARLADAFASFPSGDLPSLLDETRRLYPDIWKEFHCRRTAAIQAIFDLLFANLTSAGKLRPGLNRAIVQAFFMSSVVKVLDDPSLVSMGLSASEVFDTVKTIFLHGVLKE